MKIHSLNYEAYAIDYLEGNLSPSDKKEFEAFLTENPQINKELNELYLFTAKPDEDISFPGKKALMQPVAASKAAVFRLPSWAVAACWAVVVASMVFWLWGVQTEEKPAIAMDPIQWEKELHPSEKEIEIVRVDVRHLKKENTASLIEDKNTAPAMVPDFKESYDVPAYAENKAKAADQQTKQELNTRDALDMLPMKADLQDMQIYAQTPETVYYRPLKKLNLVPEKEDLLPQSERESKIALMTPLKKVMRPEDYQRINEFSLMDDVIKEIDGREIADAFTPEFLKNNLK